MTNYSRIGGILSIISGAFGILGGLMMILFTAMLQLIFSMPGTYYPYDYPADFLTLIAVFYAIWGIFLGLLGVLGIVGGVFALRKKHWGLALAGAIAGCITFLLCGVPAVVFVAMAKPEFAEKKAPRSR